MELLANTIIVKDLSSAFARGQWDGGPNKLTTVILKEANGALWHARFGHSITRTLQQALKNVMVDGLPSVGAFTRVRESYLCGKQA